MPVDGKHRQARGTTGAGFDVLRQTPGAIGPIYLASCTLEPRRRRSPCKAPARGAERSSAAVVPACEGSMRGRIANKIGVGDEAGHAAWLSASPSENLPLNYPSTLHHLVSSTDFRVRCAHEPSSSACVISCISCHSYTLLRGRLSRVTSRLSAVKGKFTYM